MSSPFPNLESADYIQIAILIVLAWYSIETHLLRKWQKKQVQLSLFNLELERLRENAKSHGLDAPNIKDFPIILRKIYELGEFDPKVLYSRAYHQPLLLRSKLFAWLKQRWTKNEAGSR